VRAHKGGIRISKTPKKLDSICCPQCWETNVDTLKWQRPIGEGDQELEKRLAQEEEGNTHVQEINVSQLPV
jgi:hypothetical protein